MPDYKDTILKAIGENKFNELKEKYTRTCKVSVPELELILKGLEFELKKRKEEL